MTRVLIVGASRGLGLEFVRQYLAAGAAVTATARSAPELAALRARGATVLSLDVASTEGVARLAWPLDGAGFDIAVLCAGVYGPRTSDLQPPSEADFDAVMHTNVLGAMRMLARLAEAGVLGPAARVVAVSSRMGAIGPRVSGNGWLYRASKAALNSVLKDASIALAGRAVCVSVHPGWVRTDMGGNGADLTPEHSVADLRRLIDGLTPADNGRFFDHDGSAIDW
jgi:NAD(P)-dependent dehydrogenase (short-subunit alcohol dehydrogenase family)